MPRLAHVQWRMSPTAQWMSRGGKPSLPWSFVPISQDVQLGIEGGERAKEEEEEEGAKVGPTPTINKIRVTTHRQSLPRSIL